MLFKKKKKSRKLKFKQYCPIELSVTMEKFSVCSVQSVTTWLSTTWNVVVRLRNRICTCSFNSHLWSVATILDSSSLEKFSASRRFRVIWGPSTSAHLLFSFSPTHSSHPGLLEVPQIHLAYPVSAWLLSLSPSGLCLSVTISETPTLALPETSNLPCPALFPHHSLLLKWFIMVIIVIIYQLSAP